MDIFAVFANRIEIAFGSLHAENPQAVDLASRATTEPPRNAAHGDISSNIAMVTSKALKFKPHDLASDLAEILRRDPDVVSVKIAGPGFINLTIDPSMWQKVLATALTEKSKFGKSKFGKSKFGKSSIGGRQKVNVEFVSANPTGPMHVGHTRGAVFGDALAALLDFCDYDVTREYYINDAGEQVNVLARSAFLRYREALGEKIGKIPQGLYPGDYLVPVGADLVEKFGDKFIGKPESEWLAPIREHVLAAMMDLIRADLSDLGINHDFFFSESTLHGDNGKIAQTLDWLREQGLIYEGRLDPPKGKLPEDWEDREQTLFRAKQFGDDTDRALIKSDGSYTYFAADIAYHRDKYQRGFLDQIIVLGADHSGYTKRLEAAVKAVSDGEATIDVKICQLVRLLRDGNPVKMSKRSGELVTLKDVVREVGRDATRFMMLFRRNDASMDFDFARVKEQTRDNPVFYVQYAHARASSVARIATRDLPQLDTGEAALLTADLSLLSSEADLQMLRTLSQWPRQIRAAARTHEPHRIALYLHELAGAFHALWAKGKNEPKLRFVNDDDPKLSMARLAMVAAVRQVLELGLDLLGVSAPDELS